MTCWRNNALLALFLGLRVVLGAVFVYAAWTQYCFHLTTFLCYSVLGREAPGMARTVASLPAGSRITDYISLGVIAKFFPSEKVHEAFGAD